MCGRFSLTKPDRAVLERFDLLDLTDLPPRYNIAPTQWTPVVRPRRSATQGPRNELVNMRFGLIPSWSNDESGAAKMINARSETVFDKPSFRDAAQHRRCLVLADGFFEWAKEGRVRVPHWFQKKDGDLFALAAIWERWRPPEGPPIESFSIMTTAANGLVEPLHDRMPVVLWEKDYALWLDPSIDAPAVLSSILVPFPEAEMKATRLSTRINDVNRDDPECVEPEPTPQQGSLF